MWIQCKRHLRWWWQRRTRGFDERTLWNLDFELYRWLAPRLRAFYEFQVGREGFSGAPITYFSDPESNDPAIAEQALDDWHRDLLSMTRAVEARCAEEWDPRDDAWIEEAIQKLWQNIDNLWD